MRLVAVLRVGHGGKVDRVSLSETLSLLLGAGLLDAVVKALFADQDLVMLNQVLVRRPQFSLQVVVDVFRA